MSTQDCFSLSTGKPLPYSSLHSARLAEKKLRSEEACFSEVRDHSSGSAISFPRKGKATSAIRNEGTMKPVQLARTEGTKNG